MTIGLALIAQAAIASNLPLLKLPGECWGG